MVKRLLFVFGAIMVTCFALVAIGSQLSTHYEVSRGVVIQAPIEKIFPLFGDLANWPQWEPFSSNDPSSKTTLGERTTGVGASQSWAGKGNQGRLTFTACDASTGIDYDLVFTNGEHDSPAKSWMHMSPRPDNSVELVWGMKGEMNWPVIGGYFAMFADRLIGRHFARGLAQLKTVAEAKGPGAK